MFEVIERTHAACRDCDDAQREAVKYAEANNEKGASAFIERNTPKGTSRMHFVKIRRSNRG